MNQEELYKFLEYGSEELFNKMIKRGYIEVAFGAGAWKEDFFFPTNEIRRILLAFYRPKKWYYYLSRISTYEHPYTRPKNGREKRNAPFEQPHTKRAFNSHIKWNKINMGERKDLAELVREIEEQSLADENLVVNL